MTQKMYEWIAQCLETTPGLTQRGLAEALGVNPSAVNRMIHGFRQIKVDEIPIIEHYLGQKYDVGRGEPLVVGPSDQAYRSLQASPSAGGFAEQGGLESWSDNVVPVYHLSCEEKGSLVMDKAKIVDWVARHPFQRGLERAFSLYMQGESMAPRYLPGELVYLHPGRPPEAGKDCLVEKNSGEIVVGRFVAQGKKTCQVSLLNPDEVVDIPLADLQAIYPVIGRG